MTGRRMVLTAAALGLAAGATSHADFSNMEFIEVTNEVGTPSGYVTYRVQMLFDNVGDDLVAIGSGTINGTPNPFELSVPGGIHNGDGPLAGTHAADIPGNEALGQATWDSWLTKVFPAGPSNPTDFSPGFIDPAFHPSDNPIQVLTDGLTNVVEDNGGWGSPPVSSTTGEFVVAQFTFPDAGLLAMSGVVTWNGADGSTNNKSLFDLAVFIVPAPSAIGLLLVPLGLRGGRRREKNVG